MDNVSIGFAAMGILQGIHILVLASVKSDIKGLWNRANNHGHKIKCPASGCDPETSAVILREAGEG